MIDFSIASYSSALDADIARLFEQEEFERAPEYLSWLFSPPAGRGAVAVARDVGAEGVVVGVLGMIPTDVAAAGDICKTWVAVDLIVDPKYRGRGIFTGLGEVALTAAEASGAAFVWGFPNASAAHGWFQRFSWVRLGALPIMVRPLRSGLLTRRLPIGVDVLDFSVAPRPRPRARACEIRHFGPDMDSFWAEASTQFGCSAIRDSQWLNWRTVDRPGRSYHRVGVGVDEGLAAFVVTTRAEKRGVQILYVMEAMSRRPEHDPLLLCLLKEELAAAAAEGAEIAMCLSPAKCPNRKIYRRAGFLSLPARLHPSETHFGVRPLVNAPGAATKQEAWYISYLDSDAV